ncbi:MAG TPA: PH domain-containing protein, partial [Gaiellaceae bacterium]|nr:PH domain-containing protein [Gaiellaceae bacterium]
MSERDGWHRLHPLSPVVRGGRMTIALAAVVLPSVLAGRSLSESYVQLGIVALVSVLGFVSWLVTRWRVHEDDLQIETGVLRRRSLRYPLAQVQAIDVVRPGLARMFRVAELRLRMGGASGATARLAYLPEHEVEPLRDRLLQLARGAHASVEPDAPAVAEPEPEERVLTSVPALRLAGSILITDVGLFAEAVLAGFVIAAVVTGQTRSILSAGVVW